MGLDCYVLVKEEEEEEAENETREELWYGRKENEIHGWMQQHSGIPAKEFNCEPLPLTPELMDQFEQDLQQGKLQYTPGFFFGGPGTPDQINQAAVELINATRKALLEGKAPYYFSWW